MRLCASEELDRQSATTAARPSGSAIGTGLILTAIALACLRFLSLEWWVNPQYSFGWGVPFLAAYLFWKRWPDRPAPEWMQDVASEKPSQTSSSAGGSGSQLPSAAFFYVPALALGLVAWPLRVLLEANPEWRPLLWADALILVFALFLAIAFMGGRPWLKHFFVPAVFILLAVPTRTTTEKWIIDTLTHDISSATVETMNWLGIPALLRGNLIQLRSITLGVSEACSGIRSLQTTLMAAVFFGELYRLAWWRRLALVAMGLGLGIFLNYVRTSLLTWTAATRGAAAEVALHDPAGMASLVLAIAGILAAAILLAKKIHSVKAEEKMAIHQVANSGPVIPAPHFLSWRAVGFIAVWLVFVEVFNAAWFDSRKPQATPEVAWTVTWPAPTQGFARQDLSDDVLELLRCDRSESGVWARPDGSQWTMFFLKWHAGRVAAQLAREHTPDVCMPLNGFTMVAETNAVVFPLGTGGARLTFATYIFKADEKPWYVFFCLREDRVVARPPLWRASEEFLAGLRLRNRLRAAWEGRRFYGQQVFEIAMNGYQSLPQASAALSQALPQLVQATD